jgi:hypothetical protein
MTTNLRWARCLCAIFSAFLVTAFVGANIARAEDRSVILACSPTVEAMDRCESSGGHFDTARCKCVNAKPKKVPVCALVCIDGVLDAKLCKCVQTK